MIPTMLRTDAEIAVAVGEELGWMPNIDSSRIDIAVRNGALTLTGSVPTYPEKRLAAKAGRRMSGVTSLQEHLRVVHQGPLVDDAVLAEQAVEALIRSVEVPDSVQAKVQDGVVTLSGNVQWRYEGEAAADAVRNLLGVSAVHNLILVRPTASAVGLDARIGAALVRSAQLRGKDICVTTDVRGQVRLSGSVTSWADSHQAEHSCWAAPGIVAVDNQLKIEY